MNKKNQKTIRIAQNSLSSLTFAHKAYNLLLNQLEIKLRRTKLKSKPYLGVFSPIAVCNYRCKFCESNSQLAKSEKIFPNAIPYQDFAKLPFWGKHTVVTNYYGNIGEPLLNKDFVKISKNLKSKGIFLGITTNASLLKDDIATAMVEMGFDEILVSFHAGTEKTYSFLQSPFFNQVVDNIKNLIKKRGSKKYPKVFFNFALNKHNAEDIPELVKLAKEIGIDGILANHYYHCKNYFDKDISFQDDPDKGNEWIDKLYDLGKEAGMGIMPKSRPYLKKTKPSAEPADATAQERFCSAPYKYLNFYGPIDAENTFDICVCNRFIPLRLNHKEFGDQNIGKVWNHGALRYLRKTVGKNPICRLCQSPQAAELRNTDNDEYSRLRDEAIASFLNEAKKYSLNEETPGLTVLDKNIYG